MKKTILILPFLIFSSPLLLSAEEAVKQPSVQFIYSEFFIQILATIFILWIIKKYTWKSFVEMIENRKKAINDDIDNAQKAKAEATTLKLQKEEELKELSAKKKEILSSSLDKAKAEEKEIVDKAKGKSQDLLEKAQIEVEQEKSRVKGELSKELADVSIELVKKFMFDEITDDMESKLIKQAAAEVKND